MDINQNPEVQHVTETAGPTTLSVSRPQIRYWERLLQRWNDLTESEVVVVQAHVEFPDSGAAELAKITGYDETTVYRVRKSARFKDVVLAYVLERRDGFALKNERILNILQDCLLKKLERSPGMLTQDEHRFLELSLKSAGQLRPEGQVNLKIDAPGGHVSVEIEESINAVLAPFSQPEAPKTCERVLEEVSK